MTTNHILKTFAVILAAGSLMTSCDHQEIVFTQHSSAQDFPLVEETGTPNLHVSVNLLTPDGTSENEQIIRDSILSWSLGKKYTGVVSDSSIARYKADRLREYRETNLAFYREVQMKDSSYAEGGAFNHEDIVENSIVFNSDNYLSIIINNYIYQGGAHGSTNVIYRTLNKKSHMTVTLSDLFRTRDGLDLILKNAIAKSAGLTDPGQIDEDGSYFAENIKTSENFILEENGIRWMYNQYEIRPYAYGTTDVFLSYDELSPLLKDEFLNTLL